MEFDALAAYTAKFGKLIATKRIFFRMATVGNDYAETGTGRGLQSVEVNFDKIVS